MNAAAEGPGPVLQQVVYHDTKTTPGLLGGTGFCPMASSLDADTLVPWDRLLAPRAQSEGHPHASICYLRDSGQQWAAVIYRSSYADGRRVPFAHALIGPEDVLIPERAVASLAWNWTGALTPWRVPVARENVRAIPAGYYTDWADERWAALHAKASGSDGSGPAARRDGNHTREMSWDRDAEKILVMIDQEKDLAVRLLASLIVKAGSAAIIGDGFATHEESYIDETGLPRLVFATHPQTSGRSPDRRVVRLSGQEFGAAVGSLLAALTIGEPRPSDSAENGHAEDDTAVSEEEVTPSGSADDESEPDEHDADASIANGYHPQHGTPASITVLHDHGSQGSSATLSPVANHQNVTVARPDPAFAEVLAAMTNDALLERIPRLNPQDSTEIPTAIHVLRMRTEVRKQAPPLDRPDAALDELIKRSCYVHRIRALTSEASEANCEDQLPELFNAYIGFAVAGFPRFQVPDELADRFAGILGNADVDSRLARAIAANVWSGGQVPKRFVLAAGLRRLAELGVAVEPDPVSDPEPAEPPTDPGRMKFSWVMAALGIVFVVVIGLLFLGGIS